MKTIKIYNSLTRKKEIFFPITSDEVKLYVCGITVYDYCHIGHARMMIVFDLICRWLRNCGYKVTYVRNITDIDDKIIKRSIECNINIKALTDKFISAMQIDINNLGIEPVNFEPRVTEHIPEILDMIDKLLIKGYAYIAENGDINYSVRKFPRYGQLSSKSLDKLLSGKRIEINEAKNDPLDFVLWKNVSHNNKSIIDNSFWSSRWGIGRPGWHIECSAMSCKLLGTNFDIHGGGQDLQFPHHDNEIAQSEGVSGKTFVNYWMHNGQVQVNGKKMSKSSNNSITLRDVLLKYDGEVIRFFFARNHYRSTVDYNSQLIEEARLALTRLYRTLDSTKPDNKSQSIDWSSKYACLFVQAMNDDFNTAIAISILFELAVKINQQHDSNLSAQLRYLGGCIGFLQKKPEIFLQNGGYFSQKNTINSVEINSLILDRNKARLKGNFQYADQIRKYLFAKNIIVEDNLNGITNWRRI